VVFHFPNPLIKMRKVEDPKTEDHIGAVISFPNPLIKRRKTDHRPEAETGAITIKICGGPLRIGKKTSFIPVYRQLWLPGE